MSSFSFTSMTMTPESSNRANNNANNNNYNAYSSFLSSSSAFTRPVKQSSSPAIHEAPVPFSRKRTWGDESGDETPSSSASLLMSSLGNGNVSPNNNNATTKRPRGPLGDITNLYRC